MNNINSVDCERMPFMTNPAPVAINVKVICSKVRAILAFDGTVTEWIPRFHILDYKKDEGIIVGLLLPKWLAFDMGFV